MHDASRLLSWRAAAYAGTAFYVAACTVYLFFGQANADEGWYLYASRLVFQGQVPYRDFAYTQMPLLPYVYGLPQLISHGLYTGRLTSIALAVATLALCLRLATRHGGTTAAGVTALLLGTFTYGIYYVVIVKTYALLALLFAATVVVLTSRLSDTWKLPLAVTLSFLAMMARLSAAPFLIVIVVYSVAAAANRPARVLLVCAVSVALAAATAWFVLPNLEAARWNVLTFHTTHWSSIPVIRRIAAVALERFPDLIQYFDLYFLLMSSLVLLAVRDVHLRALIGPYLRRHAALVAAGVGLALFAAAHFGAGDWHVEYFVPAAIVCMPFIATAFAKVYDRQRDPAARRLLQVLLAAALIVPLLRMSIGFIDLSGGEMPIQEIRDVSAYLSSHSTASDKVFALEGLWTVVEADRSVLPSMTMAQFSFQAVDAAEAARLKIVNGDIVVQYLNEGLAKSVVLTDGDWSMFKRSADDERIRRALLTHYRLVFTKDAFGQHADTVYVYMRRGDGE